jgi:hypothetical protein
MTRSARSERVTDTDFLPTWPTAIVRRISVPSTRRLRAVGEALTGRDFRMLVQAESLWPYLRWAACLETPSIAPISDHDRFA